MNEFNNPLQTITKPIIDLLLVPRYILTALIIFQTFNYLHKEKQANTECFEQNGIEIMVDPQSSSIISDSLSSPGPCANQSLIIE